MKLKEISESLYNPFERKIMEELKLNFFEPTEYCNLRKLKEYFEESDSENTVIRLKGNYIYFAPESSVHKLDSKRNLSVFIKSENEPSVISNILKTDATLVYLNKEFQNVELLIKYSNSENENNNSGLILENPCFKNSFKNFFSEDKNIEKTIKILELFDFSNYHLPFKILKFSPPRNLH